VKDYYKILGISRKADSEEIKKSFRKLAIAYHPDHNPSKDAEAFIKEVIEAYDVLDDPQKRAVYDSLLNDAGRSDEPARRPHRDPRYRRRAPDPNYKSESQEMFEMMQTYLSYALFVSWATLAFCIFLLFDFSLKPREQTEVIKGFALSPYRSESSGRFITDRGHQFKISREAAAAFRNGESITVAYSPILTVPLFFRNERTHQKTTIPATIYGSFSFAPVCLLLTSITGVVYRRGTMFRFNLGIVNFLLLMLNVLFLFVHHLHLS
jgi:curved DNA-binding protein CbpA